MGLYYIQPRMYYIRMAQPTDPPVSFRPGEERLARIEAWAKKRSLSRHLAILTLIDEGLRAHEPGPPTPKIQAAAKPEKPEKPEPFKTRLKGEWKAP